ncbi:hypothetical protein ABZ614_25100 [Streptomyces sp. NPDC013178]|uniref:hypothetical protein n=1 Tax=Streptomyces sp. NPDC013178 TaxID=3155118 RepID=UPI0034028364
MAVNRRRGRRSAVIASVAAAVALSAGLLTGCEVDDSLDCLSHADDISDSLTAIHEAGVDATQDPTKTEESVDTIEKNLDKIDARSDDSEVDKAVKDLGRAIEDYNRDVLDGRAPDSGAIDKAAGKLRSVCTS